ncbi:MAG: glycolate oxidase iron-sulfur subunit, partial [Hyphomicrobiaceae bacterium]
SCMTTCPGGVDYMHLVDHARAHIEETGQRSLKERLVRRLLAFVIPDPNRFRYAILLARLGRPFRNVTQRLGFPEFVAMLDLAPKTLPARAKYAGPGTAQTIGARKKRVLLLPGCAQQVLRPEINDATIRLLAKRGVEVIVAAGSGCCGALVQHMGKTSEAMVHAKRNVDAWIKEIGRGPIDAIIVNASGCGTTVKDYGHLLKREAGYEESAEKISSLAKDVSEFLSGYDMGPPKRWSSLRVAYHSACSLQHGQSISEEPSELLRKAGFTVVEIAEGHICCGSAGTYNILQRELAGKLLERKVANIAKAKVDVVAAGNIGCITQIASATQVPIVHTVELLDWAYGGPIPRGLEHLKERVSQVPEPVRA